MTKKIGDCSTQILIPFVLVSEELINHSVNSTVTDKLEPRVVDRVVHWGQCQQYGDWVHFIQLCAVQECIMKPNANVKDVNNSFTFHILPAREVSVLFYEFKFCL